MGIYYNAYYGVGYKLKNISTYAELEVVETKLRSDNEKNVEIFMCHDYNEEGDAFIVLKDDDAYANILSLSPMKEYLDRLCERLGIEIEGEFNVCGGLCIN